MRKVLFSTGLGLLLIASWITLVAARGDTAVSSGSPIPIARWPEQPFNHGAWMLGNL